MFHLLKWDRSKVNSSYVDALQNLEIYPSRSIRLPQWFQISVFSDGHFRKEEELNNLKIKKKGICLPWAFLLFLKALTNIKELQGYKAPVDERGIQSHIWLPWAKWASVLFRSRPRPLPAFLHALTIIHWHFSPLDPQGFFLHYLSIQWTDANTLPKGTFEAANQCFHWLRRISSWITNLV